MDSICGICGDDAVPPTLKWDTPVCALCWAAAAETAGEDGDIRDTVDNFMTLVRRAGLHPPRRCAKCGHRWRQRRRESPKVCPVCKSEKWAEKSDA
jgi:predicted Zn-ribbon and HTH transcriptional regulator